ncbi:daunorubicin/doxorubicin resistance ABC transporter ATP-binding protein DrrA, partial [Candidatus Frankia alpina]
IDDLGLRRPTLDDVFLALTGHPVTPDARTDDEETARTGGDAGQPARPAAGVAS